MSTHTPGPWMWDSDPVKGDPLNRVRFRVVSRGKTVTQCYYSSSDEQAEHDARLIAAAPELLEALQALRLAREQDKYPSWEKGVPNFNKAEALADVAIAKATQ
jgi:hypothetical protein